MLPSLKTTDLNDLIKEILKPKIVGRKSVEHTPVGSGITSHIFTGYDYKYPEFEFRHSDIDSPNRVGLLGGFEVHLDPMLKVPRMVVSKRFREIQHPDLVKKTQDWMNEFFGYEYPVYVVNKKMLMHSHAFQELRLRMTTL